MVPADWKTAKSVPVLVEMFNSVHLTGSLTSSRHCTSIPAAVSRLQVGTQSSLRLSQGFNKAVSLSPFLFAIVIDFVMRRTMDKPKYGIV